jgi:hypothetical protein
VARDCGVPRPYRAQPSSDWRVRGADWCVAIGDRDLRRAHPDERERD